MDAVQVAVTAYKNRSAIKRFLKWLVIGICVFAFFVYLVVATVLIVISSGFKPSPKAVVSTANQVKN